MRLRIYRAAALPQPACACASPPNALRRPELRFAHPIRPSNPFNVFGTPASRWFRMIPPGYSLPKCFSLPDLKKQIPTFSISPFR